jgi:hypothetical protein
MWVDVCLRERFRRWAAESLIVKHQADQTGTTTGCNQDTQMDHRQMQCSDWREPCAWPSMGGGRCKGQTLSLLTDGSSSRHKGGRYEVVIYAPEGVDRS